MALIAPLRLAIRSLFFGSHGTLLTPRESLLLAVLALLSIVSFVLEGFGLFALMSIAFGRAGGGITLGILLGVPASPGLLSLRISATVVIVMVLVRMIMNPALNYGINWLGERAAYRMRLRLLTLATGLPAINAGAIPSGELSSIINEEVARCGRALVSLVMAAQLVGGVAFSTVFLIARDPGVNLAAIAAALPVMGLYAYIAARTSKDTRALVVARIDAGSKVTEGLRALAGIQAAGGGATLMKTFQGTTDEILRREGKMFFNQSVLQYAMALVPILAGAGAFAYAWYARGATSAGALAAILMPTAVVGGRIAAASSAVVMNAYTTSVYATSFEPVANLFARLTSLSRKPSADRRPDAATKGKTLAAIELQGCSFRLPNGVWLFRELSVTAAPDRPILVRGPSGTGKSTLASIIAGANDPTEGRVVYRLSDGSEAAPGDEHLNFLSQDPAVMAGTVRQNLLLGGHDVDDSVLIKALQRVSLWDEFVPKGGLSAEIFEGGRNLSGGQIRRLGLARLLTREKGLWIFDEATASLDPASKGIVEDFIREIARTRVVLIIAHDIDFRIAGTELQLAHNAPATLVGAA
ncbi:MAG TPA: ABC transporter ATP-binding protein [Polyangia bacterium]|nr:ABC transporter ATP-binding protein [Polyangia bacterium]